MSLMEFFITMMLGVGSVIVAAVVVARITFGLGRPVFRQCARSIQWFLALRQRQRGSQEEVRMTEQLQILSASNQECVVLEVIPVEFYETDITPESIVAEMMPVAPAEPVKRNRAEVLTDFRRRFRAA